MHISHITKYFCVNFTQDTFFCIPSTLLTICLTRLPRCVHPAVQRQWTTADSRLQWQVEEGAPMQKERRQQTPRPFKKGRGGVKSLLSGKARRSFLIFSNLLLNMKLYFPNDCRTMPHKGIKLYLIGFTIGSCLWV